jgi:pimeloyl-ACP methyl ester carboxylesterase
MSEPYVPLKEAQTRRLRLRKLDYCIRTWGDANAPPVLLLHGWADTGMTFQFLADAMPGDWQLVAPDWRGFGATQWNGDGYWFPDYLADLDALLEALSPGAPVRLVGHSMGGNIAWLYAGIRPDRVSHAASLDAIGLEDSDPAQAPARYRHWLEQCRAELEFGNYADLEAVAEKLMQLAPRIGRARADFLAPYWSRTNGNGRLSMNGDPAHRRVNPVLYRRAEALSCWRGITARSLLLLGETSRVHERFRDEAVHGSLIGCFDDLAVSIVPGVGHMLHQEDPRTVAGLLHSFLSGNA